MNGKRCEALSALYLRIRGFKILDRNYHSRFGEIDIIVRKHKTVVFVEVKARGENSLFEPSYAVDIYKQRKIIKTAQFYLMANNLDDSDVRFDVIELTKKGLIFKINHIKNAFGE